MNVKRFQKICKVLSGLLLFMIVFLIVVMILGFWATTNEGPSGYFDMKIGQGFTISNMIMNAATEHQMMIATIIAVIPVFIGEFFALWKGSRIFALLAEGQSPFQQKLVKNIKTIGIVLIVLDVATPLLYSAALTLLMSYGFYFQFSLSSWLLVGLILYCAAEILNYGIALQELSDDTV